MSKQKKKQNRFTTNHINNQLILSGIKHPNQKAEIIILDKKENINYMPPTTNTLIYNEIQIG